MPRHRFALKAGGPKRLVIESGWFGGKHVVSLDDKPFANLTRREAAEGWQRSFKNGDIFSIKRVRDGFDIRLNGNPIADSATHPQIRARATGSLHYGLAGLNVIFAGLVLLLARSPQTANWPAIIVGLIAAVLYVVLGWFIRRGSTLALGISLAGYLIDSVQLILGAFAFTNPAGLVGLFMVRGIILWEMFRSIGPLLELRRSRRASSPPQADNALPEVVGRMTTDERTRVGGVALALGLLTIFSIGLIFTSLNQGAGQSSLVFNPTPRPTATRSGPTPIPTFDVTSWPGLESFPMPTIYSTGTIRLRYHQPSNRLYGLMEGQSTLWWFEVSQRQFSSFNLINGFADFCIDATTDIVYLTDAFNGSVVGRERVFGTEKRIMIWNRRQSAERGMGFRIACAPERVYVTDANRLPDLWAFDLAGPPQRPTRVALPPLILPSGEQVTEYGIENMILNVAADMIFFRARSAGGQETYLVRARLEEDTLVVTDQYTLGNTVGAASELILLLDEVGGRLIVDRLLFSLDDLQSPRAELSLTEPIQAVDWDRNWAASLTQAIDLTDFSVVPLPPVQANEVAFDRDGHLYLFSEANSALFRMRLPG